MRRTGLDPWCLDLLRHLVGWDLLEVLWDGSRAGMEPTLCFTTCHPILLLEDRAGMAILAGALGLGDGNHSQGREMGSVLLSPPVLGCCDRDQMLNWTLPAGI